MLGAFTVASGIAQAKKPSGFDLNDIPKGASVTLPQPATVVIPLSQRVTLTATDMPQTLKLSPAHTKNKLFNKELVVAVYDSNLDRVKYLKLDPKMPTLYRFHSLGSIALVPKTSAKGGNRNLRLVVESDKPLEISK